MRLRQQMGVLAVGLFLVLGLARAASAQADLAAAEGFPQDGFAKHLGHKVTVRGTSIPRGTRPLFQVRSVEKISDVCAPEPPQTGK